MFNYQVFYKIALILLYILASILIVASIKSPSLINDRAGVISLTEFKGHKPFQYRVLMPLVIRGIEYITPQAFIDMIQSKVCVALENKADQTQLESRKEKLLSIANNPFRACLFFGINIVLIFAFFIILRKLLFATSYFKSWVYDLLPLSFVLIMPIFYGYPNYIYDFMHLMLFTLGLYAMYKEKWLLYILILPLAILNKETAIMLTVIFAFVYYKKLPRALFRKMLIYQVMMFIVLKLGLYLIFMENPGSVVEYHIQWNLKHLSYWHHYFRFEPIGKGIFLPFYIPIPWPIGLNLPFLGITAILVIYDWINKPPFFRKATIYFPLTLVLALTMGLIPELRAYYDMAPIVFILAAMGFNDVIRDVKRKFEGGYNAG